MIPDCVIFIGILEALIGSGFLFNDVVFKFFRIDEMFSLESFAFLGFGFFANTLGRFPLF